MNFASFEIISVCSDHLLIFSRKVLTLRIQILELIESAAAIAQQVEHSPFSDNYFEILR